MEWFLFDLVLDILMTECVGLSLSTRCQIFAHNSNSKANFANSERDFSCIINNLHKPDQIYYSYLRESIGLARAALRDLYPTVAAAIINVAIPKKMNTFQSKLVR